MLAGSSVLSFTPSESTPVRYLALSDVLRKAPPAYTHFHIIVGRAISRRWYYSHLLSVLTPRIVMARIPTEEYSIQDMDVETPSMPGGLSRKAEVPYTYISPHLSRRSKTSIEKRTRERYRATNSRLMLDLSTSQLMNQEMDLSVQRLTHHFNEEKSRVWSELDQMRIQAEQQQRALWRAQQEQQAKQAEIDLERARRVRTEEVHQAEVSRERAKAAVIQETLREQADMKAAWTEQLKEAEAQAAALRRESEAQIAALRRESEGLRETLQESKQAAIELTKALNETKIHREKEISSLLGQLKGLRVSDKTTSPGPSTSASPEKQVVHPTDWPQLLPHSTLANTPLSPRGNDGVTILHTIRNIRRTSRSVNTYIFRSDPHPSSSPTEPARPSLAQTPPIAPDFTHRVIPQASLHRSARFTYNPASQSEPDVDGRGPRIDPPRRKSRKSAVGQRLELEEKEKTVSQRNECREVVRDLVKEVWGLQTDRDIDLCPSATTEQSDAYELEQGPGPDPDDLLLYMHGEMHGRWNKRVCEILLERLMTKQMILRLSHSTADYMLQVITRKCTGLRAVWRRAQPQLLAEEGRVETADEVAKYANRAKVLSLAVREKVADNAPDAWAWQWLYRVVVDHLGEDGMSSDESEGEELGVHMVYRKKRMPWRRNIDRELALVDRERMRDRENWAPQGSKPAARRSSELISVRPAVKNLPRALYDDACLSVVWKDYMGDENGSTTPGDDSPDNASEWGRRAILKQGSHSYERDACRHSRHHVKIRGQRAIQVQKRKRRRARCLEITLPTMRRKGTKKCEVTERPNLDDHSSPSPAPCALTFVSDFPQDQSHPFHTGVGRGISRRRDSTMPPSMLAFAKRATTLALPTRVFVDFYGHP
ncbi:hypothetical protein BDW22DRAFT_1458217 [Trametopsis cervina]|nr:hypothetical protein BDW22DRAFT_1458217 [Trametopsis cervina]